MATAFVDATSVYLVSGGLTTAWTLIAPADLEEGDILFMAATVQGYSGTTLTVPDVTWTVETPRTIGDQLSVVAFKYASDAEPASYSFSCDTAARPVAAVLGAYRGVRQDLLFDPVHDPSGFFAPGGSSGGTTSSGVGGTSITSPANALSAVRYSRAIFFFCATHGSAVPVLGDVSPLVPMRVKAQGAQAAIMLCDTELPNVTSPVAVETVASNVALSGAIGRARVLEPLVPLPDTLDTYKAKVLRRSTPPPFDVRWGTPFGTILTVVGASDNAIGGLFGADDFLPNQEP